MIIVNAFTAALCVFALINGAVAESSSNRSSSGSKKNDGKRYRIGKPIKPTEKT